MTFFNHLVSYRNIMQFQTSSRQENADAEDNTSRLLKRGGTPDLPLLRTLLVIRQKFQEPSFWEMMDSFV